VADDEYGHQNVPTLRLSDAPGLQDQRGGRSLRIIHLSDLHFGPRHQFGGVTTPQGDVFRQGGYPTLAELVCKDVPPLKGGGRQIICVTGDLTETADREQFREAKECCKMLEKSLGPLALVPGNHDVDWTQADVDPRIEPWQDFLGRFRPGFDDWEAESRDARVRTDLIDQYGVVIVEINSSAYVQKGTANAQRGAITPDALGALETQLGELEADNRTASCVKIALVHHHPILIPELAEPGRGYEAIVNSALLLGILGRHGFHLLLHGHKHVPFTFTEDSRSAQQLNADDYPLFVVCGGSAGTQELLVSVPINTYNIIDIKWLPGAKQYRCRVETRELVQREHGEDLIPKRWHWKKLSHDDRSFRPANPYTSRLPAWREFDNKVDDDVERQQRYLDHYCVFPTVLVRPSLTPGQAHEAVVELRYHPRKQGCPDVSVKSVKWSAGPSFGVYDLKEDCGPSFRVAFAYYGSMLIQASVTFSDQITKEFFVYAHFEKAPE
jgi:3',5'-cyclic AMP phosphodiesterase CpdA